LTPRSVMIAARRDERRKLRGQAADHHRAGGEVDVDDAAIAARGSGAADRDADKGTQRRGRAAIAAAAADRLGEDAVR
ncbi:hypothetical protein, partial [Klebsiella michiganensis]|uniref:hypothetical protein n=1 Tax=Klebsiella michiganensis TaxID=1134687 RepID=UPI0013D1496B